MVRRSGWRTLAAVFALVLVLGAGALSAATSAVAAPAGYPWRARLASAHSWATNRSGHVGYAITNEQGTVLGGYRLDAPFKSASVVKAMFLVCYLNDRSVRGRALTSTDRAMLGPMIRRSSDAAANRAYEVVDRRCLHLLARSSGMRGFTTGSVWGLTRITPAGTARLFFRIDRAVVPRHRAYARSLLGSVVPSQRWGIAQAVPEGFTIYFKGGFVGPDGGRVENQGALLERSPTRRLAIAVLTDDNPTHRYGAATQRGIARLLLAGYR